MTKCLSYDLIEWGKPYRRFLRDLPDISNSGVLIRVKAAGLCHSDLHIKKGYADLGDQGKLNFSERGATLPLTCGHEVAGIVENIGPLVKGVSIGESVLVFPWIGCGNCYACLDGIESDCMSMQIIGLKQNGGFASHIYIEDDRFLVNIDGLNPVDIAPHACSGVTTLNALEKMGQLRDHEWMAIIGCGGLGLNGISIALAKNFSNIIAVDVKDDKIQCAKEMGAAHGVNIKHSNPVKTIQKLANNNLMGVIDTVGNEMTGSISVQSLSKGGRYIVVGQSGGNFKLPQIWLPQKSLTIRGSHVGNLSHLNEIIKLARSGKLRQIPIERRPLSEINKAMDDLENGNVLGRIVLEPDSCK